MSESPPTFAWGHININVEDLNRSVEFYQKLGFSIFLPGIPYLGLNAESVDDVHPAAASALGLPEGIRGRACIMQLDDGFPKIDLTQFVTAEREGASSNSDLGLVRLCLVSRDLHQDYERLLTEGVRFLSPPRSCRDGMAEMATCVDPDGTLIELLQVYLEKWPRLP